MLYNVFHVKFSMCDVIMKDSISKAGLTSEPDICIERDTCSMIQHLLQILLQTVFYFAEVGVTVIKSILLKLRLIYFCHSFAFRPTFSERGSEYNYAAHHLTSLVRQDSLRHVRII